MSTLKVHVEFIAGTNIHEAVNDSMAYIQKTEIGGVYFKFNGIQCSVNSHSSTDRRSVDMIWEDAMSKNVTYCYF